MVNDDLQVMVVGEWKWCMANGVWQMVYVLGVLVGVDLLHEPLHALLQALAGLGAARQDGPRAVAQLVQRQLRRQLWCGGSGVGEVVSGVCYKWKV